MARALLLLAYFFLISNEANAVCASLVKGPMVIKVQKCLHLAPNKYFSSSDEKFSFIKDLSVEDRTSLFKSYSGMFMYAQVLQSGAVRSGLTTEKGALGGEKIYIFSSYQSLTCNRVLGQRLRIRMDEQCCEGGGQSPCLLDTSYAAKDIKLLKSYSQKEKFKKDPEGQKILFQANRNFKLRRYDEAIVLYSKLLARGKLDIVGRYHLSYSLRALDRCGEVNSVLRKVFEVPTTNSLWVTHRDVMKKSVFLYARCLAKTGNLSQVSLVLDAFLANPVLYKQEIRSSLTHSDFGRIRTTKFYQSYVNRASRVMGRR